MFVSGVIAAASMVGTLVLLFVGALVLTYVDNRFGKNRQH